MDKKLFSSCVLAVAYSAANQRWRLSLPLGCILFYFTLNTEYPIWPTLLRKIFIRQQGEQKVLVSAVYLLEALNVRPKNSCK